MNWRIDLNHTLEYMESPADSDIGELEFALSYQYFDNLETSVSGLRNVDNNPNMTEFGAPESSFTLSTLYSLDEFSALWQTVYQSEQQFNYLNTNETQDIRFVDEYYLHNVTVGYEFTENITARVIINNVFDEPPPFPLWTQPVGVYDLVGRSYTLSATTRF
jgi:outer membrane receptor protein involved in Fe transport